MNWFYSKDGQQLGPVAFSEIERLLEEGQITEESLVWKQGTPNWVKLSTVLSTPPAQPVSAPPIPETASSIPAAAPAAPAAAVTPAAPAPAPAILAEGKTNGFAITSLVLSIIGLVCCQAIVLNIGAVVFGHLALSQIAKNPALKGKNLALAGLIIGYIGLALGIVVLIFNIFYGQAFMEELVRQQQLQSGS